MKVRHFRRQYQGLWRQISRLAVAIVCFELLLFVVLAHRAEAGAAPPAALPHGEKLAS